ncbi:hypothetical protein BC833DRAFT_579727 [Globomyces pollinis-pini]|nr:hypothetical protein BC833DRAFT_579727 [Globomyces pollinis-pini]
MVCLTFLIASLLGVQAHLLLKTPAPRGSDMLGQLVGPCGEGLDSAGSARTTVENGKLSFRLGLGDPNSKLVVNLGLGANPSKFPKEIFSANYTKAGYQPIELDFTKVSGINNGPITIQLIQIAGDGVKHMCVDLALNGLDKTSSTITDARPTSTVQSASTSTSISSLTRTISATVTPLSTSTVSVSSTQTSAEPIETEAQNNISNNAGDYSITSSAHCGSYSVMSVLIFTAFIFQ